MSNQLEALGIGLHTGFDAEQLDIFKADLYVVGNAMSRGKPIVEEILNRGLPYISGPQWLGENVLRGRWVLAVAGTHGKTTTSSMLAHILDFAGVGPGVLIGGVPVNFGISARSPLGDSPFFVIEADEYDTAFFDKRSKFVHYRPRTAILNNLEYDHADIFPNIEAIQTQFHHLIRTVPANGLIVANGCDAHLETAIKRGCWTPTERFGPGQVWDFKRGADRQEGQFDVLYQGAEMAQKTFGTVNWDLTGTHNTMNALAAIAAARHAGVPAKVAVDALNNFQGVARRMQVRGVAKGVTVYDDFAHHPTAIATTLNGLRRKIGDAGRIYAVLEPRSNTMKLGMMTAQLPRALETADIAFCHAGGLDWDAREALAPMVDRAQVADSIEQLIKQVTAVATAGDHVLCMSNGGFGGIHGKLLAALA